MMDMIMRRREMMQTPGSTPPIYPIQLFTTITTYKKNTTRGSITVLSNGFRLVSTGSANWALNINPTGTTSDFKTWAELKGHTIKFEFTVLWATTKTGATAVLSACLCDSVIDPGTRFAYEELVISITDSGLMTWTFVVPETAAEWTNNNNPSDTDFFMYRIFFHAPSGADIYIQPFACYDMGII